MYNLKIPIFIAFPSGTFMGNVTRFFFAHSAYTTSDNARFLLHNLVIDEVVLFISSNSLNSNSTFSLFRNDVVISTINVPALTIGIFRQKLNLATYSNDIFYLRGILGGTTSQSIGIRHYSLIVKSF